LVTPWEGWYINGYPLEWGPDIVLMHLAPIPGSGSVTGYTGVARAAPLLSIISRLKPVVLLLDFILGLVDFLAAHHVVQ
jgi:hypothetical protein